MSSDPYSKRVRELFAAPAHAGSLDSATSATVMDQGVRVRLFADVAAGEIRTLRFQAWGCPHVVAAAPDVYSLSRMRCDRLGVSSATPPND
jgi:NifU-like protein involved in Fe-S cluster formation